MEKEKLKAARREAEEKIARSVREAIEKFNNENSLDINNVTVYIDLLHDERGRAVTTTVRCRCGLDLYDIET